MPHGQCGLTITFGTGRRYPDYTIGSQNKATPGFILKCGYGVARDVCNPSLGRKHGTGDPYVRTCTAPFHSMARPSTISRVSRVSRSQINSAATSHVSFQRGPFIKRVSPNEHGTCQPMVARAKWFYSVRKVTREQARAKEEKHTHRKQPPLHVSSRRKKK